MLGMVKAINRRAKVILERLFNRAYDTVRSHPLVYFSICGLFGSIFIDWDHLFSETLKMARPFHLPILILVGCILCYSYAHMYRCIHKVGLENDKLERSKL
jgi:hypothetical protein